MHVTQREKADWERAAHALDERGATAEAKLLRKVAVMDEVPTTMFDDAASVYRAWLVFDHPKPR